MSMPKISVIICSHNPRPDYLRRVLDALRAQSLPQDQWELIIVDNRSDDPLEGRFDISWHQSARFIREQELGLTPARLRGIAESSAEFLVFVDDDNILAQDYLEQAIRIGREYPFLGAWGGSIRPEFEEEPQSWTRPHWSKLAIREVDNPLWTNAPEFWQAQPWGAGLCVRASVARGYQDELGADVAARRLDRRGDSLMSAGDGHLVFTSKKFWLGWGVFPQLVLIHLIPPSRLDENYLLRLTREMTASNTVLHLRLGATIVPQTWRNRIGWIKTLLLSGPRSAKFFWAGVRGVENGIKLAESELKQQLE